MDVHVGESWREKSSRTVDHAGIGSLGWDAPRLTDPDNAIVGNDNGARQRDGFPNWIDDPNVPDSDQPLGRLTLQGTQQLGDAHILVDGV